MFKNKENKSLFKLIIVIVVSLAIVLYGWYIESHNENMNDIFRGIWALSIVVFGISWIIFYSWATNKNDSEEIEIKNEDK